MIVSVYGATEKLHDTSHMTLIYIYVFEYEVLKYMVLAFKIYMLFIIKKYNI